MGMGLKQLIYFSAINLDSEQHQSQGTVQRMDEFWNSDCKWLLSVDGNLWKQSAFSTMAVRCNSTEGTSVLHNHLKTRVTVAREKPQTPTLQGTSVLQYYLAWLCGIHVAAINGAPLQYRIMISRWTKILKLAACSSRKRRHMIGEQ